MHPYKEHYACFECCIQVRPSGSASDGFGRVYPKAGEFECPKCKGVLARMGKDFKAPKKLDKKGWKKAQILHQKGIRWSSCGCSGPGHNFKTVKQAKAYQPRKGLAETMFKFK